MPARNSLKEYLPNSYYHVYNRGVDKQRVFRDEKDYRFFLRLFRKYLDRTYSPSPGEITRPSVADEIELLAYCLMPNHFHLLLYQKDNAQALEKLFRSVMTAYVMYFNTKYARVGPLFQGRYKASRIDDDAYLYHISRYIHLNPIDLNGLYKRYPYSSFGFYQNGKADGLLHPGRILELFDGDYTKFVDDYAPTFKERLREDQDYAASGLS